MSKNILESSIILSDSANPLITVGTEVERYQITLNDTQKLKYKEQLDKSIKAYALRNLRIANIFLPEEAKETSALCVIKKK